MRLIIALSLMPLTASLHADPVGVPNFSFETATEPLNGGNGPFNQLIPNSTIFAQGGTLGSWTASSTTNGAAAGSFSPSPGGVNWTSKWWDGSNIGYLQIDAPGSVSLSDVLSATLANNTNYALTVDIGRRAFTPNFNYAIELFAGTTLLDSASNLALIPNSSGTDSFIYSSGAANPLTGQTLSVVLVTKDNSSAFTEAFFDNVRLDAAHVGAVPEPSYLTLLPTICAVLLSWRAWNRFRIKT